MGKFKRELILLVVVFFTISALSQETRQRVVVMDTGIASSQEALPYLCKDGHADFSGSGTTHDNNGHGSHISGLVAKGINTKTQCITVVKYYDTDENPYHNQKELDILIRAWDHLLKLNPIVVNMSFVGQSYIALEVGVIKALISNGTKVVVAAGNEGLDLNVKCNRYPACYQINSRNFYVVAAYDLKASNYNGTVNVYEAGWNQRGIFGPTMSGSSAATANATAKILKGDIR